MKRFLLSIPVLYTLAANAQEKTRPANLPLLDSMTRAAEQNVYANIHSIVIAKEGKKVYERYFNGWNKDSLHDTRSAFKSVTSLLAGIALDKGFIKDIRQQVYSFFPKYQPFKNPDARKGAMTVKDLLEMKSGFDCEEFNDGKDCEDEMSETNDWLKFSLDLPLKNAPGKVWAYTSCNPVIVGGIISQTAGMPVQRFAEQYLFRPLGIRKYRWTMDATGHVTTAGSFFMLPADMLKLGELVRQNGTWQGRQIVSSSWLRESTTATTVIRGFSFAEIGGVPASTTQAARYGYYWYRERIKTVRLAVDVLFASGNGGQYIMIINELGLVVVFTQGNYGSRSAKRAFDLLVKYILPAFSPQS
ncbi:serine hydrolase [Chitinophaga sp. YIM B06452]|uniref:serine hydrolase domain-containing protein n=1 Tax=Chitinophaga sp. YIM B06452 TaxID=3082158 RepID=UPI0031FEC0FA